MWACRPLDQQAKPVHIEAKKLGGRDPRRKGRKDRRKEGKEERRVSEACTD